MNEDDLKNISTNVVQKYILMQNIDLDGDEWTPIGSMTSPFVGVFDGNGYEIINFTIAREQTYTGLY